MALTDYFSPVAFFILLRESIEAGIIIAVLLGFISQIVPSVVSPPKRPPSHSHTYQNGHSNGYGHGRPSGDSARSSQELLTSLPGGYGTSPRSSSPNNLEGRSLLRPDQEDLVEEVEDIRELRDEKDQVIRKMRLQIWSGAVLGGSVAMAIGAIFLYVFYTYTHDLWQDAENLWEGGFCALASVLILVMGLAFLRLPHAQTKWRLKLLSAYHSQSSNDPENPHHAHSHAHDASLKHRRANKATAILFGLPFITVLREGLEGVVFLGGIGLSEKGSAVAGGGIGGLIIGGLLAWVLFSSTTPLSMKRFTTLSSLLLFLIGAGLASRAAYAFERQYFISYVGTAAAEAGNGPGSYRVKGNIWHLTWWDPEPGSGDNMSQLAQALVGWNNTGTWWTISTYMAYWLIITLTLIKMKYKEGRTALCGQLSRAAWEREFARRERGDVEDEVLLDDRSDVGE
ncbi:iron ion transporter [Kwoniella heveanensis CBS 569]|uniref:Iron ion transporter n=1 Tax=Kwoniella heveanensis BCC8398 TaxID=1296120 RepID=A0A1B9GWK7_9TREE|nr:iron ion transporter [Kwoniella heveanensis BCC8398]OCF38492.1 iron ion transporter [Kwoniella heveanensis CBS 569]